MYARELFIAGTPEDFREAFPVFKGFLERPLSLETLKEVQCVVIRASRESGNLSDFFKEAMKNVALDQPSAEACYELGEYYASIGDEKEASIWYYNAAYETEAELNIHYGGDYPLVALARCYQNLGMEEEAMRYKEAAEKWSIE